MGGQKSVAIACVFTYHLPLRVLLLPEGGDLRYYRLFSQPQKKSHFENHSWHQNGITQTKQTILERFSQTASFS